MRLWRLRWLFVLSFAISGTVLSFALGEEGGLFGTPKGTEGTRIFKATEHPFYSGEFHLKGDRATLIGSMRDKSPWDHLDYAGKHLQLVNGNIKIDVNEVTNRTAGGRVRRGSASVSNRF